MNIILYSWNYVIADFIKNVVDFKMYVYKIVSNFKVYIRNIFYVDLYFSFL